MTETIAPAGGDAVWVRRDAWIAIGVALLVTFGAMAAIRAIVAAGNKPSYYQADFGPAVLAACGRGFLNPPDASTDPAFAPLRAFLLEAQPSFDCASLPVRIDAQPLNVFQQVHQNLLTLAGLVWRVTGISWASLAWLSAMLMGVATALAHLFFRSAMGAALSVVMAAAWATSPLHLSQVPQLRDYAKAPFFMLMLCAVVWAGCYRAGTVTTVVAMAAIGALLGYGLGIRTDVATYLPFIVAVLVLFRPRPTLADCGTRVMASAAAVAMFMLVAGPVLRGYQSGNNLAHVAILGLTDPSRDQLRLQAPAYSYGYEYDDSYMAAVIGAHAERLETRATPALLGSADYAYWGNDYYSRLLRTFPADMITRAWAAVGGAIVLPFQPYELLAPDWAPGSIAPAFAWRGALLGWLALVSPLAMAVVAVAMIGAVNARLGMLTVVACAFAAGATAVQFQGRHTFQLEVLPFWAYGFAATAIARRARAVGWRAIASVELLTRAAVTVLLLATVIVVPIAAARRYQSNQAGQLFAAYDSAATEPLSTEQVNGPNDSTVLIQAAAVSARHQSRFLDSDMLALDFGGDQCDADVIGLTFRYHATAPYPDLSRQTQVPMPPVGAPPTRVMFPVYSTGGRMTDPDALSFAGLEVPRLHRPCLLAVRHVKEPDRLPLLMEAMLEPEWRARPMYEMSADFEPRAPQWRFDAYAVPEGLQPGRHWLSQIQKLTGVPSFRSKQVSRVDADGIDAQGAAPDPSAYLVTWPYEQHEQGSAFFVEGELIEGGVTIGVQQDERWVHQLNLDRQGKFRAVIQLELAGSFGAVLANHQARGGHHSTITRYGWLPPLQSQ